MLDKDLDKTEQINFPSIYLCTHVHAHAFCERCSDRYAFINSIPQQNIKTILNPIHRMEDSNIASKPKIVQQESPEEIERKAKELAQKESNENSAVRRKNKQSTALGSLIETALSPVAVKTKTGT